VGLAIFSMAVPSARAIASAHHTRFARLCPKTDRRLEI
jgi:hypothetical protein